MPHNFVTSYIWELPFGKGRRFMSSAPKALELLAGGWQWQGINTIQSGVPFNVSVNVDRANTGVSQRPDAINTPVTPHSLACWYFTSSNPGCKSLLPTEADTFVLPAQFTYGNAGRNPMRGDRLVQFDMSLIKHFRISENKGFEFRAQVFNLTNTPSFASPSGTVNLATGGLVSSTTNQPRLYEFGFKFNFQKSKTKKKRIGSLVIVTVVKRTFTLELSNMLGTREKGRPWKDGLYLIENIWCGERDLNPHDVTR